MYMNIKKSLFMALAATAAIPAMAQYEGTQVYDRIGHGTDSIECLNNLSMFGEYYKSKSWDEAYPCWKFVMDKAPLAQATLYTRGQVLLENLCYNATDQASKKKYLDELMTLFDTRIKYEKELNSFSSAAMQTNKGSNLCRKAYYYANYGPSSYSNEYSLDKAYSMFSEGIQLVNEDATREIEGFVLDRYFVVSYEKYKADKAGFREQFLKDYLLSKEVCEKMLERANQAADSVAAQKIVDQYDPTLVRAQQIFAESKAADRNELIAIFTPKVEEKKSDLAYLRGVIDILADNDCDDTDVYFKASKYAFDIEPSYNAAIGTAQWYSKQGKVSESIQYYDKAIQLCDNDKQKARIAMKVVYALAKGGNGSSVENYLQKVSQFDPSMAGRCDMFRAQRAAASRDYSGAITYATRAAQEDAAISGTANRLKARIQEAQRKQAEYDKANAAYKAQLEKQQKLENFWKGN